MFFGKLTHLHNQCIPGLLLPHFQKAWVQGQMLACSIESVAYPMEDALRGGAEFGTSYSLWLQWV